LADENDWRARKIHVELERLGFSVVPTVTFRLLFVWFVIDHGRRGIIHCNVTSNPTPQWVIQQLRESFPDDSAQRYLIFDNDSIFSDKVSEVIKDLDIEPKRTAFHSPWQNGTAERWVGSCKRELIDHVIVFNEEHLRRLLRDYLSYYNVERVHTVLRDSPEGRPIEDRPLPNAKVVGLTRVGGLHHRYAWKVAA
jgi:transposase InsO family protein